MPEEYHTYRFEPDEDPNDTLTVADPDGKSVLGFVTVVVMFVCSISLYVGIFALIAWMIASMLGLIG